MTREREKCAHEGCEERIFVDIHFRWRTKGRRDYTAACKKHAAVYLRDVADELDGVVVVRDEKPVDVGTGM
jgi:hypothetical protein